jgi:hypothetical protein
MVLLLAAFGAAFVSPHPLGARIALSANDSRVALVTASNKVNPADPTKQSPTIASPDGSVMAMVVHNGSSRQRVEMNGGPVAIRTAEK